MPEAKRVLDPACGKGHLLAPWSYRIGYDPHVTCDIANEYYCEYFEMSDTHDVDLIVCNPPFVGMRPRAYPEVFMREIHDRYPETPTMMFWPLIMQMNQRSTSKRYRWLRDEIDIGGVVRLPSDIFPDVMVAVEILLINFPQMGTIFLPDDLL